ncbi:MAG: lipase [Synechococcales cyanobacterium T60_A2020_003]|nr:lipase [Synechococcales cyanobacterium T60_A2020_003]
MPLPTVILPGYLAGDRPYREMEQALSSLGITATTVPLKRQDWFPTLGGRSVTPILNALHQTVEKVRAESGSDRVNLVGHSAGGWIARIYLGEVPYDIHPSDAGRKVRWNAHSAIATLVTLGTPHISQERWTKRNLDFVKENYPGAFYPSVQYVCVAGKAMKGEPFSIKSWRSLQGWFTYSSYQLTCGQGNCWGDEITPVEAAHLEGATNLVLDQVVHSPRPQKIWYGSADVVPQWAKYLAS